MKPRYRRRSRFALSLLLGCALLTPAFSAETDRKTPYKKLWADSWLGKKAPPLSVSEWVSDVPNTEGKYVLVDFWATWCGPCRAAIPELNTLHKTYADQLVIVGLSDEKAAKVRSFKKPAIQYFSGIDPKAKMKKAMGVKGIPHVVIINPQGVVVWEGFPLLKGHELTHEVIEQVLAGKTPDAEAAGLAPAP